MLTRNCPICQTPTLGYITEEQLFRCAHCLSYFQDTTQLDYLDEQFHTPL